MRYFLSIIVFLLITGRAFSQKSPQAKILFDQAKADTTARLDSIASIHFYEAAKAELKMDSTDYNFAARMLIYAARRSTLIKDYVRAHDIYNEAIKIGHKAPNKRLVFVALSEVGTVYENAASAIFTFPALESSETVEANFSILVKPEKKESGKYVMAFRGGSNDGVYAGAEGKVFAKMRKDFEDRENTRLGTIKIIQVHPGFSLAEVEIFKTGDPFFEIYPDDMVAVPIRIPKKVKKDIFLEVSLLNIHLMDNNKKLIAHPRTLMYYHTPELETDVYAYLKDQAQEAAVFLKNDTVYNKPLSSGRFKGKNLLTALIDTKVDDLKAFLDFIKTFAASYMGQTFRFSEIYATWVVNKTPPGYTSAMDSLNAYIKNENLFSAYLKNNQKDILNTFFERWLVEAQVFSEVKDFVTALHWNAVMEKVSRAMKNDSLLAWTYFNRGLLLVADNKDSVAIENYKKAIPLFKKAGSRQGESYAVNNIGSALQKIYRYKESQGWYEQALQIRMNIFLKDTSDDVKREVARAHSGIGYSLYMQSKYKEAIEEYRKGVILLQKNTDLNSKQSLAPLYSGIGKSFEKMGQYKEAADYYDLEYSIRKALGDVDAMADALDQKGYLLSLTGENREAYNAYRAAYDLHLKVNNINEAGFSMSGMGQRLWNLGKFDSAISAHNTAIDHRKKAGNEKGQAYSWRKLGGLYKDNGQPQKSLEAFVKALEIYKKIDDKENYASLLEDFASNYNNVNDYAGAIKYYRDALAVYRLIQSKSKIANVIYNLATIYYNDKQFEHSEALLDSAIALQSEIKDQSGLLISYIYKGQIQHSFYTNYSKAVVFMKQALQLAENTTSKNDIAYTHMSLGGLYQDMGRYDSGRIFLDLAMKEYKELENISRQAQVLIKKGYHFFNIAEYGQAKKIFKDALEIARQSGNKGVRADAMTGMAQIEMYAGNFSQAYILLNDLLQMNQEDDNPWGTANAYLTLGNLRLLQSGYEDAVNYYNKSDSVYKTLRLVRQRATAINNIGAVYFDQNDYDKALASFEETLKILQTTNDDKSFIALVKSNIGEVYVGLKKYSESDKWLTEALNISKSIGSKRQVIISDIILGKLKTITKDYASARTFFEDAEKLINETGETLNAIALEAEWGKLCWLMNDIAGAEKHLQNCIKLSLSTGYRTYIWKAYATNALIKAQQNNTAVAITEMEKAIKVIEELKNSLTGGEEAKKIFSNDESVVELYQRMAKYLKEAGRNDEALAFIEKSNIENINLRLKNDAAIGNAAAREKKTEISQYVKQAAEELSKPQALQNKEKIARLEKMTTIAEEDYQQFISDLAKKYPGRTDLQRIDAKEFRKERKFIPQDVALLSYLLTDNELSVFIVMKDTLLIKDIPVDRKLLEKKINHFYNASSRPPSKDGRARRGVNEKGPVDEMTDLTLEQMSEELYSLLVGPARDAIEDKKRIAIVPSGLLCFVPFQSLGTKSTGGMNYFGDDKQIFYVNKITTVTNGRNESLNDLKIVAVGNADNTLENAEVEVKSLKKIFPAALVYVGKDATKQKVLNTQGEYNILHLATHGILDYANAENSYLVFAPDKITGDDGRLKINDIYRFKNFDRFRMVTLSACQTGVVQNIAEGWPISTASAFIEAGVPTVIATLWKVDDKATSILVEKFYENMKTMDKVAALQKAQLYLKQQKEYEDPNYWAPFQLVGLWQ